MARVLQFPDKGGISFSEPDESKGLLPKYNPIKPTIRQSVAWMFFDGERSVRSIHGIYRREGVQERDVEAIIREYHRSALAVAKNIGRLRALGVGEVRRAA